MIKTIKDLKEIIQNLPDDMVVMAYNGGDGGLRGVGYWIHSEDTLTEEEVRESFPNGVIPTFVIDVD